MEGTRDSVYLQLENTMHGDALVLTAQMTCFKRIYRLQVVTQMEPNIDLRLTEKDLVALSGVLFPKRNVFEHSLV